jgi:hypothetical protein
MLPVGVIIHVYWSSLPLHAGLILRVFVLDYAAVLFWTLV